MPPKTNEQLPVLRRRKQTADARSSVQDTASPAARAPNPSSSRSGVPVVLAVIFVFALCVIFAFGWLFYTNQGATEESHASIVNAKRMPSINVVILSAGEKHEVERPVRLLKSLAFSHVSRTSVHVTLLTEPHIAVQLLDLLEGLSGPWFSYTINTAACERALSLSQSVSEQAWFPAGHYAGFYALSKLFLPVVLPHLESFLFFDDDIVLLHDLKELWDAAHLNKPVELSDGSAGVVGVTCADDPARVRYYCLKHDAQRNCLPTRYCNSGTLFFSDIDVDKWLHVVTEAVTQMMQEYPQMVKVLQESGSDMDVFNRLLATHTDSFHAMQLPCEWACDPHSTRRPCPRRSCALVHFLAHKYRQNALPDAYFSGLIDLVDQISEDQLSAWGNQTAVENSVSTPHDNGVPIPNIELMGAGVSWMLERYDTSSTASATNAVPIKSLLPQLRSIHRIPALLTRLGLKSGVFVTDDRGLPTWFVDWLREWKSCISMHAAVPRTSDLPQVSLQSMSACAAQSGTRAFSQVCSGGPLLCLQLQGLAPSYDFVFIFSSDENVFEVLRVAWDGLPSGGVLAGRAYVPFSTREDLRLPRLLSPITAAVDALAEEYQRQVVLAYGEPVTDRGVTWMLRK